MRTKGLYFISSTLLFYPLSLLIVLLSVIVDFLISPDLSVSYPLYSLFNSDIKGITPVETLFIPRIGSSEVVFLFPLVDCYL